MKTTKAIDGFTCDTCGRKTDGENGLPLECGWVWIAPQSISTGWATDDGGQSGDMPKRANHFCRAECFITWLRSELEKLRLCVIGRAT
jgi:hypothetical protein